MSYHTGVGGSVFAEAVEFDTVEWSLRRGARLQEVTNSKSGNAADYLSAIREYSGSVTIIWDDDNLPETNLAEGSYPTLKLVMGDSGLYHQIDAVVETLEPKVNIPGTEAVKYTFTWKGTGTIVNPG